jgi:hypothetical protein
MEAGPLAQKIGELDGGSDSWLSSQLSTRRMKEDRHVQQPSLDPNLCPASHLFGFTSPSLARSSFDGAWSVVEIGAPRST